MSYEGSKQHICMNGHRFDTDYGQNNICPFCKKRSAFINYVDHTNGDSYGTIVDWSSFLISPEVKETCSLGHEHVMVHAIYRIPSDKECQKLRCYGISPLYEKEEREKLLWNDHKYIPLSPEEREKLRQAYTGLYDPLLA